jgi:hypothetical protein
MASAACKAFASVVAKSPCFIHSGADDASLKLMVARINGTRLAVGGRWTTDAVVVGAVFTIAAGFIAGARQAFMEADNGAGSPANERWVSRCEAAIMLVQQVTIQFILAYGITNCCSYGVTRPRGMYCLQEVNICSCEPAAAADATASVLPRMNITCGTMPGLNKPSLDNALMALAWACSCWRTWLACKQLRYRMLQKLGFVKIT